MFAWQDFIVKPHCLQFQLIDNCSCYIFFFFCDVKFLTQNLQSLQSLIFLEKQKITFGLSDLALLARRCINNLTEFK